MVYEMLMEIATGLPPRRFGPIQIHLLLQEAAQLCATTPTLNLRPADGRTSIRGVDRRHRRCICRRRSRTMFKVLRLDLLSARSNRSLVLYVDRVVGGVVATVNRVVEGTAECF